MRRTTQPAKWPPQAAARAVAAVALLLGAAVPARSQEIPAQLLPIATEAAEPVTASGDFGAMVAVPTPLGSVSALDPETYEALKAAALSDPNAEIPDEIVPLVFPKGHHKLGEGSAAVGGVSFVTTAASQLRSFAGLDFAASIGSDGLYRPPDTTLGKSSTRVLEGTNSRLRLTTPTGGTPTPPNEVTKSLNDFFGANPSTEGVLFDPRVVYDRLGPNQRFFVVALQRNTDLLVRTASIYVAVSKAQSPNNLDLYDPTNNPAGQWCAYKINSVRPPALPDPPSGTPTWADYPMVGVGADAFLVSNDQFTFPTSSNGDDFFYRYGILRVVRKDLITNNASSCPAFSSSIFLVPKVLTGTEGTDKAMGHVQPAVHATAPTSFATATNPVYMVSAVPPPSATYRIWRVRNAASGSPVVDLVTVNAFGQYIFPPKAYQPAGGVALLDTKDNRIMQVAAIGDTLWAAHVTGCEQPPSPTTGAVVKTCIRVLRFFVSDSGGALTALLQQDVTFASPDTDYDLAYFMPGIAVTSAQQTAVVFLYSSPFLNQSAAWTVKYLVDALYAPAVRFSEGMCSRTSDRLGDYVGAQTNPSDLASFWLAGESAASHSSGCRWATQIVQVTP